MTIQQKYETIIEYFQKNMPEPRTELFYKSPFQLLIAVILSAQCTDRRVNAVTPALFERFPTPESLAGASFEDVYSYIKSISYPNNKAKHLIAAAKRIVEVYQGQIPKTVEELQTLQGVGRKTAHVIASVIYNQPTMAVDTHIFRVSHRLGLVSEKAQTPLQVEKELTENIPPKLIPKAHHWLILHGRYICKARKPLCEKCAFTNLCSHYEKNYS